MINLNDIPDNQPPLKLDDIQGIIVRGYTFPYVRYIVFKINDKKGTQDFFTSLLPGASDMEITSAKPWEENSRPEYTLTIGLTYSGMRALMSDTDLKDLANNSSSLFRTFKNGAIGDDVNVGDVGESDPANWWKNPDDWKLGTGGPSDTQDELQILVTIYAENEANRDKYHQKLLNLIPEAGNCRALQQAYVKDSNPLKAGTDYIHFGYKDSFSQPRLNVPWNTSKARRLLGVSNIDDRPIVPSYHFVIVPQFPMNPTSPDGPKLPRYSVSPLLHNGSFAAFRVLHQDVKTFKEFINDPKHNTPADLVAAKMCGRWYDGTPLVVSPDGPDKKLKDFDFTNFNYIEPTTNQKGVKHFDDLGQLCPYAAHIRRTNPRDDDKVQGNDNDAQDKRIMRRAGPYGPDYDVSNHDNTPRGLVGLFICADLRAQFSFIMSTWITSGDFRNGGAGNSDISPNKSGVDALFGPARDTDDTDFDFLPANSPGCPKSSDYKRLTGLKQFIRTDGGLYVFLPGIEGLKHLANGTIPTNSKLN